MSRRKHNGCFTWGGSIVTAVFISIFIGVAVILGLVKIASLKVVWKEEDKEAELKANLESITPLANSTLVFSESRMAKDKSCLFTGPYVIVENQYAANVPPMVVYGYYDRKLREEGWIFFDTRGSDWNNDGTLPYLEASYYKQDGYHALLEYARKSSGASWTYRLLLEWQGSNYPCASI
jgi:hypothetical protein